MPTCSVSTESFNLSTGLAHYITGRSQEWKARRSRDLSKECQTWAPLTKTLNGTINLTIVNIRRKILSVNHQI